jgi:hypothetical protein
VTKAEQVAVVPPFDPVQLHVHGPAPLTLEALPELQRFKVGADVNVPLLDEPHAPLTCKLAEQLAFVPPLIPAHVHVHGPVPVTVDAGPALHRLADGAVRKLCPLDGPHAPLTIKAKVVVYASDPVQPFESVALIVKLNVPFAVGVPESTPAVVSVSPAGRVPVAMLYVYGPVPPLAVIVWL